MSRLRRRYAVHRSPADWRRARGRNQWRGSDGGGRPFRRRTGPTKKGSSGARLCNEAPRHRFCVRILEGTVQAFDLRVRTGLPVLSTCGIAPFARGFRTLLRPVGLMVPTEGHESSSMLTPGSLLVLQLAACPDVRASGPVGRPFFRITVLAPPHSMLHKEANLDETFPETEVRPPWQPCGS